MKNKILILVLFAISSVRADEGMWMPQLIEAWNIKDMKANGFKLSAKDIYDINKASMKDAVAIFGGGCTAEVISGKGLILTNHHCGFAAIASLSSVENDYLKNGFFAMDQSQEMYCKGLSVTFIKRIDDVTSQVLTNFKANFTELQKDSTIQSNIKNIEAKAKQNSSYDVFIRPFFYGNEYYMFTIEAFKDVRLVGTPPESIGKFGGETDNWVWPRHNADFSMFRIYASKENKPAEYSKDNVPYKADYSFPISLKETKPGDFTMVYGFPGRTQEYLTSFAVELLVNQQDPVKIKLREKRLAIMAEDMKKNDTLRLMYANRYANVANAYKKWKGEVQGLTKSDAINKKRETEALFMKAIANDPAKRDKFNNMFTELRRIYADYAMLSYQYDYYTECLWGIDGMRYVSSFAPIFAELKKKQSGKENKYAELLKANVPVIPFKNYNKETDKKLFIAMLQMYGTDIDNSLMPVYLDSLVRAHGSDIVRVADYLYSTSLFVDNAKAKAAFADFEGNAAKLEADPFYVLAKKITMHYQTAVIPQLNYYDQQLNFLQKEYVRELRETMKDKKFYPDANGTLRVAYGKISGYKVKDAMEYDYYTTLDGLVEKNKSGEEDFYVKPRLLELYEKKDFGKYADKKGKLHTAFIASNHTTGGNSGSPVLNAKGELIGTNFDRNWEGTMSDIMYNPAFCRNIVLDVHYTLWIVDKYAGAGYLLKEMKIKQ